MRKIAKKLKTKIGSASAYVIDLLDPDAIPGNDTLVIRNSDGTNLVANSVEQLRAVSQPSADTVEDVTTPHYDLSGSRTLEITLQLEAGASFPFNETWAVTLDGITYEYDVPDEDNLDECTLCDLCIAEAPKGSIQIIKLYE